MINVIHAHVLEALGELADEARQRRLWLASGGPEVSSFTECISQLWDDSGLTYALDRPQGAYTDEIDARLRAFGTMLDKIDDRRAPEEILADPRLVRARTTAAGLLEALASVEQHPEP